MLDTTRRSLLLGGGLGSLGLGLPGLLNARAASVGTGVPTGLPSIRSCIMVFYYGGPSHLDSWDPKPDAPAEIRGEFKAISTSVPGISICEHLPLTARVMHKVAIVRSMHHAMRNHDSACTETLTGRLPPGGDRENFSEVPVSFPSHGATLSHAWKARGLPLAHASLPYRIRNVVTVPGQSGGFLGPGYDPLLVESDLASQSYRAELLGLPEGIRGPRFERRRALLGHLATTVPGAAAESFRPYYERAFALLDSEAVRAAVDLSGEDPRVRDRYGRGLPDPPRGDDRGVPENNGAWHAAGRLMRGQNLLLARRLVEAGVPFVSVYDYQQQGQNWDAHSQNFQQHKNHLLPPADRAFSALVDDLDARGLLESTLVVALGEFGRTPRINKDAGRDHWPDCYSVVMAGGGVKGGSVYGASDKIGAFPATDGVTPADLAATIFWRFGLDHTQEIKDATGRPYRLAEGEPIRGLFA
ncbi:DUF1501 domain-containing protein [Isosphaeraceae bacterium EP7]